MARFYLDENLAEVLVLLLAALGHDVVSTGTLGRKGALDYDQLRFAAMESRILITFDRGHFILLHGAWLDWSATWRVSPGIARHAGILVLQQDKAGLTTEATAQLIHDFVSGIDTLENRLFDWTREYGWRDLTPKIPS